MCRKSCDEIETAEEVNIMERYEAPEMEIVQFDSEDVITTSGDIGIDEGEVEL